MGLVGRVIRSVGNANFMPVATGQHNFERIYSKSTAPAGTDVRYHYGDTYFQGQAGGEYLRVRGIADGNNVAHGGTINAIHATGRVAAGKTVSGALNAIRATLEVAGTTPTPGGTLAALQLDSNIVTGATLGAQTAFVRVSDSGATACPNLFYFDAESGCLDGTNGTYSTADGYIKIRVGSNNMRIPYFAGTD